MNLFYTLKLVKNFLRIGFIASSGRNFLGQICIRHRGGALKRQQYYVDFFRRLNLLGFLIKVQKTPFYTGNLGLIVYQNGLSNYTLLAEDLNVGDFIFVGTQLIKDNESSCKKLGSSIPISYLSLFSKIHNLELYPFKGGQLARAAGTSVIVSSKTVDTTILKVKSGWSLRVSNFVMCSIGLVSNSSHRYISLKKAGLRRNSGFRPSVRGVAMNPCDHPHGGGEGRKSPPAAQRSIWGWLTKNTPSLKKKYQKTRRKLLKALK